VWLSSTAENTKQWLTNTGRSVATNTLPWDGATELRRRLELTRLMPDNTGRASLDKTCGTENAPLGVLVDTTYDVGMTVVCVSQSSAVERQWIGVLVGMVVAFMTSGTGYGNRFVGYVCAFPIDGYGDVLATSIVLGV